MSTEGLDASSFHEACRNGGQAIARWLRQFDARFGRALYAEAAHVLRDWHRGEDAVQDALIKVWQRCATFRGEGHPLAWIKQVLRRTLLDMLRAQPPEEPLQLDDGDLTPAAAQAVTAMSRDLSRPDEIVEAQLVQRLYQQCWLRFARAHPEHATVLRWVAEDGMSLEGLAVLLGRTPGATKEYVSQCRKKARPFLEDWRALVKGTGAAGLAPGKQA